MRARRSSVALASGYALTLLSQRYRLALEGLLEVGLLRLLLLELTPTVNHPLHTHFCLPESCTSRRSP